MPWENKPIASNEMRSVHTEMINSPSISSMKEVYSNT